MTYLELSSTSLFSKWGFNDGDWPEALLDWHDEQNLDYPAHELWHPALCLLVRGRLVPMLPVPVEVYEIETIHNPIRAKSVAGVAVEWDGGDAEAFHTFTGVTVRVPLESVLAAIEEARSVTP